MGQTIGNQIRVIAEYGEAHTSNGCVVTATDIGTNETPILTIRNKLTYKGKPNIHRVKLMFLSVSVEGVKPSEFAFRSGVELTGADYNDVEAEHESMVELDVAATAFTNGFVKFGLGLPKSGRDKLPLALTAHYLYPGDTFTVTAKANIQSLDAVVAANWEELDDEYSKP